jgi:hypothetical protein
MVCGKCDAYVHESWFGYKWNAYVRGSVLATIVTPMAMWPFVTGNNLGVWSCLDVV